MIPYSTQTIGREDIKAVIKVLNSPWLTTGPAVERFEKKVAKFVGAKYAVAVSSGTAALHTACFAAGITPGDQVITSPYSFAASANCAAYLGARPVLTDINPDTLCIDIDQIKKRVSSKTKAIIAVDFAGLPADWQALRSLAQKHDLTLIADGAHSFGGKYRGKPVGTLANLTAFSFHPVKSFTTGEGGMVTTNNKRLYERMRRFRTHGISYKRRGLPWFYQMEDLGFNYRLTDIQSALGLAQLKRVRGFLRQRRALAQRYSKALSSLANVIVPVEPSGRKSAWHLYPLRINFKLIGKTKVALFKLMQARGIGLQVHYVPIHYHPYYRKNFGYKKGDFPVTEQVYEQEVSLPLYPNLKKSNQDKVINLINKFVSGH